MCAAAVLFMAFSCVTHWFVVSFRTRGTSSVCSLLAWFSPGGGPALHLSLCQTCWSWSRWNCSKLILLCLCFHQDPPVTINLQVLSTAWIPHFFSSYCDTSRWPSWSAAGNIGALIYILPSMRQKAAFGFGSVMFTFQNGRHPILCYRLASQNLSGDILPWHQFCLNKDEQTYGGTAVR